jgi:hypothetical protein
MPQIKVVRIANPHKKASRKRRPLMRKKSNPGLEGVLTLMSNPRKKTKKRRNPFAKLKAKARNPRRSRRANPYSKVVRRHKNRRRNPMAVAGNSPSQILMLALGAGAGAVGTRGITQLVLKSKNEGPYGYAANVVAALGLGFVGAKFLGPNVGNSMLAGGLAATVQRLWDDKVSKVLPAVSSAATGAPAGTTVKGLGDVSYSDDGLGRAVLGDYVNAKFPYTENNGPYGASAPALPAAAPAANPMHASKW